MSERHTAEKRTIMAQNDFPVEMCVAHLYRLPVAGNERYRQNYAVLLWHSVRILERIRAVELYPQQAGDRYPILGGLEGPIAEMADVRG